MRPAGTSTCFLAAAGRLMVADLRNELAWFTAFCHYLPLNVVAALLRALDASRGAFPLPAGVSRSGRRRAGTPRTAGTRRRLRRSRRRRTPGGPCTRRGPGRAARPGSRAARRSAAGGARPACRARHWYTAAPARRAACTAWRSCRVVEDQAEGVPAAGPDHRHAVPYWRGGPAAGRGHLPVPGGEHQPVALRDQRRGAPRLGPRPLLDEQDLPAGVICPRVVEVDHDLQREYLVAVQVAVQGVPVAGLVAQQDRGGPGLPGPVTDLQPFVQGVRPLGGAAEPGVPVARDRQQPLVQRRPQRRHRLGERLGEVPVLAGPEPVPGHVDRGPEPARLVV